MSKPPVPRIILPYGNVLCTLYVRRYNDPRIQRSEDREVLGGQSVRAFHGFSDQATRRLTVLDNAAFLRDLAGLPSNRLEALSGDRIGQYSIRINRQWRICFRWEEDGPHDVEVVDYH